MVVFDLDPNRGVHLQQNIVELFLLVRNLSDLGHVNLLLVLTFLLEYTSVVVVAWTTQQDLSLLAFDWQQQE
eukprot:3921501-Prorocentrum_lima.AAC.1